MAADSRNVYIHYAATIYIVTTLAFSPQVFPDGELTIEAVNPENATFDRPHPIGKSAVRRGGGVPVTVKTRVPPEFGGGGRSGRPGAPPPHAGPPTGGEGHVMNAIGSRLARTGGMNSSR